MKKLLYSSCLLFTSCFAQAQTPSIAFTEFATGFSNAIGIENCGDDRLFIVQQAGLVRILNANGTINAAPFLDVDNLVPSISGNSERGLLGLAFHPDYANNGYFYINYTRTSDGATRVSRFSVNPNDPNDALENTEFNIVTIAQPYSNHNGGQLRFGPDGYLYIGMGDGGLYDDPQNNGQDMTELLGKMLRVDVDNASPYGIPSDNPFATHATYKREIWASGLRNPWRFNFDRCTDDLWISDVGQDYYEEVNFQPASSAGGENYGWRCREGLHVCPTCVVTGCGTTGFTDPVAEYTHSNPNGCSITGGFVYRGGKYGGLFGHYLFTDFCSGRVWATKSNGSGGWNTVQLGDFLENEYSTFGEDYVGELYISARTSGKIYKISESTCLPTAYICGGDVGICEGSEGVIRATPGAGNTYQWAFEGSDIINATSDTYTTSTPGTYSVTVTNANNCSATSNEVEVTINPLPTVSFSGLSPNYCINYSPSTLTGSPAGGTFSGPGISGTTFDPSVSGAGTHNIIYTYTNNNGCTEDDTLVTTVSPCTSIDEQMLGKLSLYPNPADNQLTIEFYASGKMDVALNLYNATGQLVRSEQRAASGGTNKFSNDISMLSAGIYIATIESASGKEMQRFVVGK